MTFVDWRGKLYGPKGEEGVGRIECRVWPAFSIHSVGEAPGYRGFLAVVGAGAGAGACVGGTVEVLKGGVRLETDNGVDRGFLPVCGLTWPITVVG